MLLFLFSFLLLWFFFYLLLLLLLGVAVAVVTVVAVVFHDVRMLLDRSFLLGVGMRGVLQVSFGVCMVVDFCSWEGLRGLHCRLLPTLNYLLCRPEQA